MTITFWCPDAPTTRVQPYPEEEPGFWDDVSTLAEANFANGNAKFLLRQLDIAEDDCGTIEIHELPDIIGKLEQRMLGARLSARVEELSGFTGLRTAELRRYTALQKVLSDAQAHQFKVAWG